MPVHVRALTRQLSKMARCGFQWNSRFPEPDHLTCTCKRPTGHYERAKRKQLDRHACNCGKQTPIPRVTP